MVMKMKWLKELLPYVVILIVVVLIRSFIVTPIKVHGESMYDTLEGNEIMILNKLDDIDRYDIVVANLMSDGKKLDTLIKRIYGRQVSLDSHIFGPIKKEDIEGVTDFIIWPFSKFGKVQTKEN